MVGAEIQLVQDGYAVRQASGGLRNKQIFVTDTKEKASLWVTGKPLRTEYYCT